MALGKLYDEIAALISENGLATRVINCLKVAKDNMQRDYKQRI
jgi:hypothetical protein